MLAIKTARSNAEMIEMIEGTVTKTGSAGTNTAASPNFQDLTAGAFTGVVAGDVIYISGSPGPFTPGDAGGYEIITVTDANNIVLAQDIADAHTANAVWKIKRGGIGEANLAFDPIPDNFSQGHWKLIYYVTQFNL